MLRRAIPRRNCYPDRPGLDQLLVDAGLELEWNPDAAGGKGAFAYRSDDGFGRKFEHVGGSPDADDCAEGADPW